MTKIPEDVMKAARDAYLAYPRKGEDEWLPIARAIMADRERSKDRAYDIAADWHDKQARMFMEMANDAPRTAESDRTKADYAAKHHAGSAAALRLAALNQRRKAMEVR